MIYLDNNATMRMAPTVIEAMADRISMHYGNPSSTHQAGYEPRKLVANARRSVADLLGARDPGEIVFTSCGSESDNWAILGALEAFPDKRHIVTTRVEHEAVRKLCEILEGKGYALTWLDVDEKGTEAAAGTAVVMMPASAELPVREPPQPILFRADHPFAFAIRDLRTGAIPFLQYNDNTVERVLFYQALNVVLAVLLDDELELADYEANFRRMFGDARMNAAIGSVDGSVRFHGLTPTSLQLEGLDRHQRLIDSYRKLHKARARAAGVSA